LIGYSIGFQGKKVGVVLAIFQSEKGKANVVDQVKKGSPLFSPVTSVAPAKGHQTDAFAESYKSVRVGTSK
jgi:hypothetical protein